MGWSGKSECCLTYIFRLFRCNRCVQLQPSIIVAADCRKRSRWAGFSNICSCHGPDLQLFIWQGRSPTRSCICEQPTQHRMDSLACCDHSGCKAVQTSCAFADTWGRAKRSACCFLALFGQDAPECIAPVMPLCQKRVVAPCKTWVSDVLVCIPCTLGAVRSTSSFVDSCAQCQWPCVNAIQRDKSSVSFAYVCLCCHTAQHFHPSCLLTAQTTACKASCKMSFSAMRSKNADCCACRLSLDTLNRQIKGQTNIPQNDGANMASHDN